MAFVNEIISEEDIQKYGLDEVMRAGNPSSLGWYKGRPEGYWHAWTIDRERDIYFMPVKMVTEIGGSGRPEGTNRTIVHLNFQGRCVPVIIKRTYCSPSFKDNPYRIAWDLVSLDTSNVPEIPKATVISVLKEALKTYGFDGAKYPLSPDTNVVVEFDF